MIFLVHYDRSVGKLVSIKEFTEDRMHEASAERVELEIALLCHGNGNEVVLLEAPSEAELRKTHRRYFDSLAEMQAPKEGEKDQTDAHASAASASKKSSKVR